MRHQHVELQKFAGDAVDGLLQLQRVARMVIKAGVRQGRERGAGRSIFGGVPVDFQNEGLESQC